MPSRNYPRPGIPYITVAIVSIDNERVRDWEQLNVLGGHCTSSEHVDPYIQKPNIVENTKIDRLYLEVRDAIDTSLHVPEKVIF